MKPFTEFTADAAKASGFKSWCRACDAAKAKAYYAENREACSARMKEWYEANRERMVEYRAARKGPPRLCPCGAPAVSQRHKYCGPCGEAAKARRGARRAGRRHELSSAERGYGWVHQKERKRWKVIVDAGNAFCARCHGWIEPGEPWDLGHVDHDRSRWAGAEHRKCNRATAGRRRCGPWDWL